MPYRTAFWILIFLTVVSAVFYMLGYSFLEVLIVLLIIDSIGFGAMIEIERNKSKKEADASKIVTQKIEGLEKICQDVLHRVSTNPALVKLEDKLREHKEEIISKARLNKEEYKKLLAKGLKYVYSSNRIGSVS